MPDPSRTSTSPSSRGPRFREILGKNVRALSLVPREQRFYDLFEQQATTLVGTADLLREALDHEVNLPARQREIKDLERLGDQYTHETMRSLNETFVTPFDHEDISALAAGLDDILDYVQEIADTVNLYGITPIPRPTNELANLLAQPGGDYLMGPLGPVDDLSLAEGSASQNVASDRASVVRTVKSP